MTRKRCTCCSGLMTNVTTMRGAEKRVIATICMKCDRRVCSNASCGTTLMRGTEAYCNICGTEACPPRNAA